MMLNFVTMSRFSLHYRLECLIEVEQEHLPSETIVPLRKHNFDRTI